MNQSDYRKLYHLTPKTLAPHLLFAHKNDELRTWLTRKLREEHYQVEEISSDLAAALSQYTPNLIVADIEMLGHPEIECLLELKQTGRLVPLVLMTGSNQLPVVATQARRLGMVVVFKTPFETCDFLTAVGFLLDCSRAARATVSNQAISRVS